MYIQYIYITNLKLHSPIRQRAVVQTYTIYHIPYAYDPYCTQSSTHRTHNSCSVGSPLRHRYVRHRLLAVVEFPCLCFLVHFRTRIPTRPLPRSVPQGYQHQCCCEANPYSTCLFFFAGYQRFSNIYEQVQPAPVVNNTQAAQDATPFQRTAPIYWTLQNRRTQPKQQAMSANGGNVTCRDDLYATPIRRAERLARAAAASNCASSPEARSNISPIVPRNGSGSIFMTSTPTRGDTSSSASAENVPPMKQPSRNWSDNSPERLNTCADRIGQSKTTLMDFKKLLLAKSAKTSPVQRKVSAVELLKKSSAPTAGSVTAQKPTPATPGASKPTLNSSLKLLDLSGSPKTFANRRMLRQGQFGSPSKTFAPKIRGPSGTAVASVGPRTDIMSTTIPEANSEEDHSNNSGGSRASLEAGNSIAADPASPSPPVAISSFDLKRNFFLQTEENNFMRGELKPSFGRNGHATSASSSSVATEAAGVESANKYVSAPTSLPAFETAL